MSSVEQQATLDPLKKPDISSAVNREEVLKSVKDYVDANKEGKKTEETDIQKIAKNIISLQLSPTELQGIMSKLPIDKRFIVEKMILDEQKHQIATMSQERYKQYLQAQFPSGVPSNIGEMALSMATDTSEMYRSALKKIETTDAGKDPSEIAQRKIKEDRAVATGAAQKADNDAKILAQNIAGVHDEVKKWDKTTRLT